MERDKFLTAVMGECWHRGAPNYCIKCDDKFIVGTFNNKFSTWQGFGKLWEWAQKQAWWDDFIHHNISNGKMSVYGNINNIIHPDRFADAIYKFLKERV